MKSNHALEECKQCAWNKGRSFTACEVFLDKRNVILDEFGRCNALANEAKKKQVELECKMTDQIEKITDKIHEEYQGLSRSEIEKIVRQTAEEIRRKDDELLANSVAGTE